MTQLGAYLRRCRLAAGLSQVNVGATLGRYYTVVWQWEQGVYLPAEDALPRICATVSADLEMALRLRRADVAAQREATHWRRVRV